jgi:outer membrane lipoprotein-sorting protein
MGDLGDLLEVLHCAGSSYRTFRGEFRSVSHTGVVMRTMRELDEGRPSRVRTRRRGSGVSFGSAFLVGEDLPDADESSETKVRVWLEAPARYREEEVDNGVGSLIVRDGVLWWSFNELLGSTTNEREEDPGSSRIGGEYESLLDPASLLALLRFEPMGKGDRAGRHVLLAGARPRDASASLSGLGLGFGGHVADLYEFEVDAEHGVILRMASSYKRNELAVIEAVAVAFDEQLPPDIFEFKSPDGSTPETEQEGRPERVAVHVAAQRAPFQMFVLSGMPEAWASFAIITPARKRPPMPLEITVMYIAGGGAGTALVRQFSHDGHPRAADEEETREIVRDGVTVTVFERSEGFSTVRVILDETDIEISSPDLEADQLVDLATRLQPAPTSPPAL